MHLSVLGLGFGSFSVYRVIYRKVINREPSNFNLVNFSSNFSSIGEVDEKEEYEAMRELVVSAVQLFSSLL